MSQQINLFNPLFLRKEKYFSARTMAQSLALIVLGLVALWGYALVQTRGLQRVADEYGQQLAAQWTNDHPGWAVNRGYSCENGRSA